ncbi:hypothetical protein HKBW3S33_02195 [Candidatus Hakubella thermalkaliphila]|uniref:Lipoyl-binding domain-containing protein n=2 Tax=Candidatus Hakubella thermalkaliphila TaxID=2754717 RepID=A0A6V8P819_9ACTN|nr:hypothetical protein HKBW3S33_02195 [Candidatus Hakubella thermalkaliphila]
MVRVEVPRVADGAPELKIVRWHQKAGDRVGRGEGLAEGTTEKLTIYISSAVEGTLARILIRESEKARVGQAVAEIVPHETGGRTE